MAPMTEDTPRKIPSEIRSFLQAAIIVGDMVLPCRYALPDEIETLQVGFRSNGRTGESLVSTHDGAWQPTWFVLAVNDFNDPFFVDMAEEAAGFPVYFAKHGGGRWDAIPVAGSLRRFGEILLRLKAVGDDDAQVSRFVEDELDVADPLWREVLQARREHAAEFREIAPAAYDLANLATVELVVTDFGAQKLKVIQIVRRILGVSPQDALALVARPELLVGTGPRISLQRLAAELTAAGARTEYRPRTD
ncbi:hypothetical protein [Burkholderia gladioli]|uniref:Ribosomal protein L7/L12 C-terminal domain-containing protein n=2 Tax=Burkholderia gladioli TaxID=28095 RepID=F2LCV1_BURGS|nr:hypothetical protein [Burkholderia gladioli]AEA61474.1 hypothetical protein bgla_1g28600 [Burkholderia gladioli BSR3]MBW5285989.1 hypothetical protein [Burkholderia gladioli]